MWEAGRLTDPEPEALAACFEDAIGDLHRLGVTAIHDIVSPGKLKPYLAGIAASRVPLRIDILIHATPDRVPEFRRMCEAVRFVGWGDVASSDYLRLAGVKCFLDGSLGGRTAALNAPYEGSDERGTLLMERGELQALARASYDGGFVCAVHAIGDRAIDLALDVVQEFPAGAEVFRIEHCEIVGPEQLRRLENAPVYLGLQPNFARRWGAHRGLYEERIGSARYAICNRFRSLNEAGVEYVFGSRRDATGTALRDKRCDGASDRRRAHRSRGGDRPLYPPPARSGAPSPRRRTAGSGSTRRPRRTRP